MTQPTRCSKRLSKSTKKDPKFLYPDLQCQLKDWHFLAKEPENNSTFKDAALSARGLKDPSTGSVTRSSLQRQQDHVTRDLSQDLKLVPLRKEKLSLELRSCICGTPPILLKKARSNLLPPPPIQGKKGTIDWPHELPLHTMLLH